MASRTHFLFLAHYNRWATRRLAASLRSLDKLQLVQPNGNKTSGARAYLAPRALPCNSIHGTLCHMLYADAIWKLRLNGEDVPEGLSTLWADSADSSVWENKFNDIVLKSSPDTVKKLLDIPSSKSEEGEIKECEELVKFAANARNSVILELDRSNEEWIQIARGLTEKDLVDKVKYRSTDGVEHDRSRTILLTHVFNHATHHRGQLSTSVSEITGSYPVMDLTAFLPEWEQLHGKVLRWA